MVLVLQVLCRDHNTTPRRGTLEMSELLIPNHCLCFLTQANIRNVGIHNLSPGMVTTELLMAGADTPASKFFINCLGAF